MEFSDFVRQRIAAHKAERARDRAVHWNALAEAGGEFVGGFLNHTADECADRAGWWLGRYYQIAMEE